MLANVLLVPRLTRACALNPIGPILDEIDGAPLVHELLVCCEILPRLLLERALEGFGIDTWGWFASCNKVGLDVLVHDGCDDSLLVAGDECV